MKSIYIILISIFFITTISANTSKSDSCIIMVKLYEAEGRHFRDELIFVEDIFIDDTRGFLFTHKEFLSLCKKDTFSYDTTNIIVDPSLYMGKAVELTSEGFSSLNYTAGFLYLIMLDDTYVVTINDELYAFRFVDIEFVYVDNISLLHISMPGYEYEFKVFRKLLKINYLKDTTMKKYNIIFKHQMKNFDADLNPLKKY
jgi:hypothetical protein